MNEENDDPGTGLSLELEQLVESLVNRKVDEAMAAHSEGLNERIEQAMARLSTLEEDQLTDRATIVVFSGDFDRLFASFIIATGAAAMGMEVSMFFTFWGLTAIKKQTVFSGKSLPEKMIGMMLPGGPETVGTSRLNMGGMGPLFFKTLMKQHNVESLPNLIEMAKDLDVKFVACQMSMGIMGITKEELVDDITYGGVAAYLVMLETPA